MVCDDKTLYHCPDGSLAGLSAFLSPRSKWMGLAEPMRSRLALSRRLSAVRGLGPGIDSSIEPARDWQTGTHPGNDPHRDVLRDPDRHIDRKPHRDTDRNMARKPARTLATNTAPMLADFKETVLQVLKQAETLAQTQAQIPPPIRSLGRGVGGKLWVPTAVSHYP